MARVKQTKPLKHATYAGTRNLYDRTLDRPFCTAVDFERWKY